MIIGFFIWNPLLTFFLFEFLSFVSDLTTGPGDTLRYICALSLSFCFVLSDKGIILTIVHVFSFIISSLYSYWNYS